MTDGWVVDPRPVPAELTEDYAPERFQGLFHGTVKDRLDSASMEILFQIARGGIGDV